MKTKVLFVYSKYRDGVREVLALFPENLYNEDLYGKRLINCYAHIGQHSSADKSFLRRKRATESQYALLAIELQKYGYNLDILNERIDHET